MEPNPITAAAGNTLLDERETLCEPIGQTNRWSLFGETLENGPRQPPPSHTRDMDYEGREAKGAASECGPVVDVQLGPRAGEPGVGGAFSDALGALAERCRGDAAQGEQAANALEDHREAAQQALYAALGDNTSASLSGGVCQRCGAVESAGKCERCGTHAERTWRVCVGCATPVKVDWKGCPSCGAVACLPSNWRVCATCALPVTRGWGSCPRCDARMEGKSPAHQQAASGQEVSLHCAREANIVDLVVTLGPRDRLALLQVRGSSRLPREGDMGWSRRTDVPSSERHLQHAGYDKPYPRPARRPGAHLVIPWPPIAPQRSTASTFSLLSQGSLQSQLHSDNVGRARASTTQLRPAGLGRGTRLSPEGLMEQRHVTTAASSPRSWSRGLPVGQDMSRTSLPSQGSLSSLYTTSSQGKDARSSVSVAASKRHLLDGHTVPHKLWRRNSTFKELAKTRIELEAPDHLQAILSQSSSEWLRQDSMQSLGSERGSHHSGSGMMARMEQPSQSKACVDPTKPSSDKPTTHKWGMLSRSLGLHDVRSKLSVLNVEWDVMKVVFCQRAMRRALGRRRARAEREQMWRTRHASACTIQSLMRGCHDRMFAAFVRSVRGFLHKNELVFVVRHRHACVYTHTQTNHTYMHACLRTFMY